MARIIHEFCFHISLFYTFTYELCSQINSKDRRFWSYAFTCNFSLCNIIAFFFKQTVHFNETEIHRKIHTFKIETITISRLKREKFSSFVMQRDALLKRACKFTPFVKIHPRNFHLKISTTGGNHTNSQHECTFHTR